jgi:TonB family protein
MPDIARPPQSEEGTAVCEFSILKDGKIANLKIVGSSGSMPLDRAAYGSLSRSSPFPPLPKEFSRPYLALRFRFVYDHGPKKPGFSISPVEATVAIGSSVQFRADENDQTASVSWRITGCNEDCGTISLTGLYTASSKVANPSKVTVTANLISNPDYVVQATVTVVAPRP